MKKSALTIFWLHLIFLTIFFYGNTVQATETALLYISPLQGSFHVGQVVTTTLWLKPGAYPIDTLVANIDYPEDFLSVEAVHINDVFSLSFPNTHVDNTRGEMVVSGGIPQGTTDDIAAATIFFLAKKSGTAGVTIKKNSRVLSYGQYIPLLSKGAQFHLQENHLDKTTLVQPSELRNAAVASSSNIDDVIDNEISSTSLFVGSSPELMGIASVGGARLTFAVDQGLFFDRVIAAADGTWVWEVPSVFLPGIYRVLVTAIHPKEPKIVDTQLVDIEVERLDVTKTLYSVLVDMPETRVKPGTTVPLNFSFLNVGATDAADTEVLVQLEYIVEDEEHNSIDEGDTQIRMVGPKTNWQRNFFLPDTATPGTYRVSATLRVDEDVVSQDGTTFRVADSFVWWILAPILFGSMSVCFFLYKKFFFTPKKD